MILRVFKFLFFLILFAPLYLSAQTASIPDPVFEQFLIDENIDSDNTVNGQVLISDVSSVTSLNLTGYNIQNFEGLQFFADLTDFTLINDQANNINDIDFYGNLQVRNISIINVPNLANVSVLENTQLVSLTVVTRGELFNSIDVSNNINLNDLSLADNAITSIDIANNTNIVDLSVALNPITNIDLSNLTQLVNLDTYESSITSLDITSNRVIRNLNCDNGALEFVNLKNGFNQFILTVDLSGNPSLSCIEVDDFTYANTAPNWLKDIGAIYANNCNPIAIDTYPYIEDFESGANGWSVNGYNPSWELGLPDGSAIQGAASGDNAWATNLTGSHNQLEGGWLESPSFDLSSLTTPYLQINIWWNCFNTSGAVIQSTFDGGLTWQNVGLLNDQPNWYNEDFIESAPGGSNVGWSGYGSFSGGSRTWLTAYHDISNLAGPNNVKFRIIFASPNDQSFYDGFAFDNFSILEAPCYAGEDVQENILGCLNVMPTVNLNYLLTSGAIENGTWTALDGLEITSNGDIDIINTENGIYRFQYTVSTEGGECIDAAIISVDFQQTLSAGISNTIETCGGEEFFRNDMFDFIELYFSGPDWSGVWTDQDGFEVDFPIFPSDGDVYIYTHAAISGCPEVSSTVTFTVPPILEAGNDTDNDAGCDPPILNLNDYLDGRGVNARSSNANIADLGGRWTWTGGDGPIVIEEGGEVDEVDFGTLGAGQFTSYFKYEVDDPCGLSNTPFAEIAITVTNSDNINGDGNLAVCNNEQVTDELLDAFIGAEIGDGQWFYYGDGDGNFGDLGEWVYERGCGNSPSVMVYLNAVRPKVMLQGAILNPNVGEDNLMRDDLRVLGYLPSNSPYPDGASITGDPFSVSGPNAIIDWVWVELRNAGDNSVIESSQSALLQRDGDVVGLDGVSALCFKNNDFNNTALSGNYFVAIKHRNHLAVMTAAPISIGLSFSEVILDFTDAHTATFGTNAQTAFGMPIGILGLWSGNTNSGNEIKFSGANNDSNTIKDFILADPANGFNSVTFSSSGYLNSDLNLDGIIKFSGSGNDSNIIKDNVLSHPANGFNSPTFTIVSNIN